jgi:glycosyltransferase involved in cell wall biosynthesis
MRRIKVCQVLNAYHVGGAETVALDVARGLDPERFESLAVAVIEPSSDGDPDMRRRFREAGVPAHALHHRGFRDPRTLAHLAWFFLRHRPDIIHGHNRFSDYWASRVGRWTGVPHRIWTRHSVYADMSARQIARYRSLAATTPVVLAVSDAVHRNCIEVEGLAPERVRTVVNGIDTGRFRPRPAAETAAVRDSLGLGDGELMLLQVGRLIPEKAPAAFVALVERLRARGLPVRGFLCGHGPLADTLESFAPEAGVTLLGLRRDVPELLAAADLVVSTSRVEGLPLNLMEAMAAGAAFVGPDLDQVQQLVGGEPDLASGLYPAPPRRGEVSGDLVDGWAAVTAARLADAPLRQRCGEIGRRLMQEHYSVERMVDAHAEIYTALVEGRPLT